MFAFRDVTGEVEDMEERVYPVLSRMHILDGVHSLPVGQIRDDYHGDLVPVHLCVISFNYVVYITPALLVHSDCHKFICLYKLLRRRYLTRFQSAISPFQHKIEKIFSINQISDNNQIHLEWKDVDLFLSRSIFI